MSTPRRPLGTGPRPVPADPAAPARPRLLPAERAEQNELLDDVPHRAPGRRRQLGSGGTAARG